MRGKRNTTGSFQLWGEMFAQGITRIYGVTSWKYSTSHEALYDLAGDVDSFDRVKSFFRSGVITKDEYANTLRSYQQRQDEMKSDTRDKAAAIVNTRL